METSAKYTTGDFGLVGAQPSKLPITDQEKAISVLHDTIDRLFMALSPVLRPSDPTESANSSMAEEIMSTLKSQLRANNRGIHDAEQRICAILERLEC